MKNFDSYNELNTPINETLYKWLKNLEFELASNIINKNNEKLTDIDKEFLNFCIAVDENPKSLFEIMKDLVDTEKFIWLEGMFRQANAYKDLTKDKEEKEENKQLDWYRVKFINDVKKIKPNDEEIYKIISYFEAKNANSNQEVEELNSIIGDLDDLVGSLDEEEEDTKSDDDIFTLINGIKEPAEKKEEEELKIEEEHKLLEDLEDLVDGLNGSKKKKKVKEPAKKEELGIEAAEATKVFNDLDDLVANLDSHEVVVIEEENLTEEDLVKNSEAVEIVGEVKNHEVEKTADEELLDDLDHLVGGLDSEPLSKVVNTQEVEQARQEDFFDSFNELEEMISESNKEQEYIEQTVENEQTTNQDIFESLNELVEDLPESSKENVVELVSETTTIIETETQVIYSHVEESEQHFDVLSDLPGDIDTENHVAKINEVEEIIVSNDNEVLTAIESLTITEQIKENMENNLQEQEEARMNDLFDDLDGLSQDSSENVVEENLNLVDEVLEGEQLNPMDDNELFDVNEELFNGEVGEPSVNEIQPTSTIKEDSDSNVEKVSVVDGLSNINVIDVEEENEVCSNVEVASIVEGLNIEKVNEIECISVEQIVNNSTVHDDVASQVMEEAIETERDYVFKSIKLIENENFVPTIDMLDRIIAYFDDLRTSMYGSETQEIMTEFEQHSLEEDGFTGSDLSTEVVKDNLEESSNVYDGLDELEEYYEGENSLNDQDLEITFEDKQKVEPDEIESEFLKMEDINNLIGEIENLAELPDVQEVEQSKEYLFVKERFSKLKKIQDRYDDEYNKTSSNLFEVKTPIIKKKIVVTSPMLKKVKEELDFEKSNLRDIGNKMKINQEVRLTLKFIQEKSTKLKIRDFITALDSSGIIREGLDILNKKRAIIPLLSFDIKLLNKINNMLGLLSNKKILKQEGIIDVLNKTNNEDNLDEPSLENVEGIIKDLNSLIFNLTYKNYKSIEKYDLSDLSKVFDCFKEIRRLLNSILGFRNDWLEVNSKVEYLYYLEQLFPEAVELELGGLGYKKEICNQLKDFCVEARNIW